MRRAMVPFLSILPGFSLAQALARRHGFAEKLDSMSLTTNAANRYSNALVPRIVPSFQDHYLSSGV